jgi:hypothetical protein
MSTETAEKKSSPGKPKSPSKTTPAKRTPKSKAVAAPEAESSDAGTTKKKRGRSSLTIEVPINQSTLAVLEMLVTLNQSSNPGAAAAKLLATEADKLMASISEKLAGSFPTKV